MRQPPVGRGAAVGRVGHARGDHGADHTPDVPAVHTHLHTGLLLGGGDDLAERVGVAVDHAKCMCEGVLVGSWEPDDHGVGLVGLRVQTPDGSRWRAVGCGLVSLAFAQFLHQIRHELHDPPGVRMRDICAGVLNCVLDGEFDPIDRDADSLGEIII